MSAGCPNKPTDIIPLTLTPISFAVSRVSFNFVGSKLKVVSSTSIKIGTAPSNGITSAEEANVKDGTITPSPGCSFSPNNASNNASVPLEQQRTCFELENLLSSFSSSLTSGPSIY